MAQREHRSPKRARGNLPPFNDGRFCEGVRNLLSNYPCLASFTSFRVIRPSGPVPSTSERFTPSSSAF